MGHPLPLDGPRQVVLGAAMEHLEHVPRRMRRFYWNFNAKKPIFWDFRDNSWEYRKSNYAIR